ncbi:uncharacterized protein [Leptinotarsa decemlineata]|uniref:uncharacterized protein n=1 Tax=Leptinotarsa decemlineata TaxID=7539 RepID=UPI003D306B1C
METNVENKLIELIPHPMRNNRGIINGLGSIFKAISGNLDASDGERYEKLIQKLKQNQEKLSSNIIRQNSLAVSLIDKFNNTIQQINHNEKLIEIKINQISEIVKNKVYRENSDFIKDIINQLINMFEIINSILQDIENSISFAKIGMMHPSIMKTKDLLREITDVQNRLKKNQIPVEIRLENIMVIEKLIKVDCYLLNNKITYILRIPITHPIELNLHHLYSIHIPNESHFKAIIPENKYLLKNELYYSFMGDPCMKVLPLFYICDPVELLEIGAKNPCEIQLMNIEDHAICQKMRLEINQPIFKRLEESNQWIGLLPTEETVRLKCHQQEEAIKVKGSYLVDIPNTCQISTNQEVIINYQQIDTQSQPILFPDSDIQEISREKFNLSLHLNNVNLDELHEIRTGFIENRPALQENSISYTPSAWTIIVYGILAVLLAYAIYKKIRDINPPSRRSPQESIELQNIQLPQ